MGNENSPLDKSHKYVSDLKVRKIIAACWQRLWYLVTMSSPISRSAAVWVPRFICCFDDACRCCIIAAKEKIDSNLKHEKFKMKKFSKTHQERKYRLHSVLWQTIAELWLIPSSVHRMSFVFICFLCRPCVLNVNDVSKIVFVNVFPFYYCCNDCGTHAFKLIAFPQPHY